MKAWSILQTCSKYANENFPLKITSQKNMYLQQNKKPTKNKQKKMQQLQVF